MPSFCSSFRFQHLSHFVGCGFRGTLLEKAGHHKNRVPYADFRHAVGGCGAFHAVFDMLFLSVIGKLLSIVHQLFQPFHFLLCLFPAEIHAGAADRGTHLCYPVINPLVGCVRGIVQLVKA